MRALLATMLLCLSTAALARDNGQYAQSDSEIRNWVNGLTDKRGFGCCATADGFRPEEVEWDIDTGRYRVRINGQWIVVPDEAVVTERNRIGYAIVWYYVDNGTVHIRCFLPGSGA